MQEWDRPDFEELEDSADESMSSSDDNGMKLIRWESNATSETISPHFANGGWQSPLLHLETLFHAADSEVSVDLTVQAANLLSEKFSSQAKKLINLSKNTVQSALEIQQRIVMPSSENSECFLYNFFIRFLSEMSCGSNMSIT